MLPKADINVDINRAYLLYKLFFISLSISDLEKSSSFRVKYLLICRKPVRGGCAFPGRVCAESLNLLRTLALKTRVSEVP